MSLSLVAGRFRIILSGAAMGMIPVFEKVEKILDKCNIMAAMIT
jgi:hypothetical protein